VVIALGAGDINKILAPLELMLRGRHPEVRTEGEHGLH
jgi:hypothetical protein